MRLIRRRVTIRLEQVGRRGPQGPAGQGVPTGGAINQFLKKNSSTDNDTVWGGLTTSSVTDNAIPRFDGTEGVLVQDSGWSIDDTDDIISPTQIFSNGYRTGGKIKNVTQLLFDWSYNQTVRPKTVAEGGDIGSAVLVKWNATIDESQPLLGPKIQPGIFGPRPLFNIEGSINLEVDLQPFGFGPMSYGSQLEITNANSENRKFVPGWVYMANNIIHANGGTSTIVNNDTLPGTPSYVDNQILSTTNGGTLSGVAAGYELMSFASVPFVGPGVTIPLRTAYRVADINVEELGYLPREPLGQIDRQAGLYVKYLDAADENIGVLNESSTVNTGFAVEIDDADTEIPLVATTLLLDNTTGSDVALTSVPTIPDGFEDGHELVLINNGSDNITLQGEASLSGSNLLEDLTLEPQQAARLVYGSGAWLQTSTQIPDGTYIPNSTTVSTGNFAIQSANASSIGGLIRGAASQTANLTEWQNSSASTLAYVNPTGQISTPAIGNTTTSSNSLELYPNFATASTNNTGRIKLMERLVSDRSFTIDANFTGIFHEWYYNQIHVSGTKTISTNGNLGEYVTFRDSSTIKWSAQQVFTTVNLFDAVITLEPVASANRTDNSSEYRMFSARATYAPDISTANTVTGTAFGGYLSAQAVGIKSGSHASAAVVMPTMFGFKSIMGVSTQATVTTARHFWASASSITGSMDTLIGVDIEALSIATTNIGVRIAKANTYSLQLSGTDGTAASGITFGTDTNLYRSAANTLKTDDALTVDGKLTYYQSLVIESGTSRTLALTDASSYIRLTNATECDVTVPDNADVAFPVGTQIFLRSGDAGVYTIVEDTSVTVNPPVGGSLVLAGDATLIKVATDEWDLVGATA